MPELPEVESLRLSLLPFLTSKTIRDIKINNSKLVSGKGTLRKASLAKEKEFISNLIGEKIVNITRRAKNLQINFASGKLILVHLKMTGQLVYQDEKNTASGGHPIHNLHLPNKHTYIIFSLDQGTLYYNDVRQFGYVLYYPNQAALDAENHFKDIGPEPFDPGFNLQYFQQKLKQKNSKIKVVLLNQSIVTGLGNIYCDEVCFASGVLPTRQASKITNQESESLFQNINSILKKAILLGGSSISNYLLADGSRGNYAREHKVYGRAGKSCLICSSILEKTLIGSRTTVYCKICQK